MEQKTQMNIILLNSNEFIIKQKRTQAKTRSTFRKAGL